MAFFILEKRHMNKDRSFINAILMLLVAIISVQSSGSLAKILFQSHEIMVVATMRLMLAAIILAFIGRIWTIQFKNIQWKTIIIYGLALAGMNGFFYVALEHLPLGLAVSFEFIGPLTVALCHARQKIDLIWVGLAIVGMCMLFPLEETSGPIDFVGIGFALAAGACWANYILSGQKSSGVSGNHTVALGMLIGTLALVPFAIATGKFQDAFNPTSLMYFTALAVLASALPFALEMIVLKRLPPLVFGTLTSLDPVVAALSGVVFLHENLLWTQWFALATIIFASMGCTYSTHRTKLKIEAKLKELKQ